MSDVSFQTIHQPLVNPSCLVNSMDSELLDYPTLVDGLSDKCAEFLQTCKYCVHFLTSSPTCQLVAPLQVTSIRPLPFITHHSHPFPSLYNQEQRKKSNKGSKERGEKLEVRSCLVEKKMKIKKLVFGSITSVSSKFSTQSHDFIPIPNPYVHA